MVDKTQQRRITSPAPVLDKRKALSFPVLIWNRMLALGVVGVVAARNGCSE